jgi:hypothetical protein
MRVRMSYVLVSSEQRRTVEYGAARAISRLDDTPIDTNGWAVPPGRRGIGSDRRKIAPAIQCSRRARATPFRLDYSKLL